MEDKNKSTEAGGEIKQKLDKVIQALLDLYILPRTRALYRYR